MQKEKIQQNKDFNKWNDKKIFINQVKDLPFFHEREIWFCSLGLNVGFEQDGNGIEFQRPVIILKKFNNNIFWALPISKTKRRGKYYFVFNFENDIESVAILSQIKLLDVHRLSRKIGDISDFDYRSLIKKLKALLP